MKERIFKIVSNKKIAPSIYKLILKGDASSITNPGQFVNILIPNKYLRRPISICDYDSKSLTLIYKVVGEGTSILSNMKVNQDLNILLPLGNGYSLPKKYSSFLLIGGGVGVPPLYNLAKQLIKRKKKVTVILGFNKKEEIFYENEFKKLGCKVMITTVDGSYGYKGFVSEVMNKVKYDYFYTCGPMPMLKAVYKSSKTKGEFSFEEKMGCGFGVCMGCSCKTITSYKRICKDGPVLTKEEILW